MSYNHALYQIVADRIQQAPQQRIPFAEYMDLALYHPQEGYYASSAAIIGEQGDFITSPHLGHDFGELLAVQLAEMWHRLGQPTPFVLVEMGAGQGLVAADILAFLKAQHPDCLAASQYWIVEKSEALRNAQKQHLADWQNLVRWTDLDTLAPQSVTGCFFSNELVDALPVHQVILTEQGLQEVYVTLSEADDPLFAETVGELSTPRLADYFAAVEIDLSPPTYPIGYRTEVNLAALDWMAAVAERLQRGYVITIDYGYPANRYYSQGRSQGTLQCYYQHAHHNDPYRYLGHQDITAHVDFTALERQGERCGLKTLGVTQQGLFLMALGLGDRLLALAESQDTHAQALQNAIRRRDQIHQLMSPMGLGNFGVLVQSKGLAVAERDQPLKGLTIPPLA